MAYTMKTEGLEDLSSQLNEMGEKAQGIAARGLYEGAGVMSEAINKAADGIKTAPFHYAVFVTREPSPEEKAVIQAAGAGIAKFNKNGSEIDTSVGYANSGYAELNGKMVPIPKIVNAVNSGTSFMKKQPFVRKSASKAKSEVLEKMRQYIEKEFEAIGKGYKSSMK